MYKAYVRHRVRRGLRLVGAGASDEIARQFAPGGVLVFPGESTFAGEHRGRDAVRAWFETLHATFPQFRLVPHEIVVSGGPWRTRVATRFDVEATLRDGSPYANAGMQLLEIRWGRITQDRLFEDTQRVAAALERLA